MSARELGGITESAGGVGKDDESCMGTGWTFDSSIVEVSASAISSKSFGAEPVFGHHAANESTSMGEVGAEINGLRSCEYVETE